MKTQSINYINFRYKSNKYLIKNKIDLKLLLKQFTYYF